MPNLFVKGIMHKVNTHFFKNSRGGVQTQNFMSLSLLTDTKTDWNF